MLLAAPRREGTIQIDKGSDAITAMHRPNHRGLPFPFFYLSCLLSQGGCLLYIYRRVRVINASATASKVSCMVYVVFCMIKQHQTRSWRVAGVGIKFLSKTVCPTVTRPFYKLSHQPHSQLRSLLSHLHNNKHTS